ncbi:signal recognition particle subunit [Pichia californica]|uniref:Signal recognition particle SEC65 subunit n=1 Tax=Pichia californica TaxID=460514 RepID=A0A9P6WNF2_9ASCO|nr:signal recognition particle subunit [[Candida] californica]KAG0690190.1 signal recognition particle subunit [[Candida] californica]
MPTLEEIEDIEDIDNLDMDLAEFDPDLVTPVAPAKPKPSVVRSQDADGVSGVFPASDMFKGMGLNAPNPKSKPAPQFDLDGHNKPVNMKIYDSMSPEEKREFKMMQIVYPCYFDKYRSTKNGRRLPVSKCVANPLAKTILDACKILRIPAVFEPEKSHPQDWGNPGRVRLGLKFEHEPTHPILKSKKQALEAIAEFMKTHPTTLKNVKDLPGPPELMEGNWEASLIPKVKGFKMNSIVPMHSSLTMKNPETAGAYIKTPVESEDKAFEPKKIKQKVKRIRA